jgi:hypothetical protein
MFKLLCNVGFKYLCGAIICISGVQLKKNIFKTFSYFYNRAV